MLLHCPLGMWKKETNILSTISNSLHLTWHFINTMFNQGVNLWFNLYHRGSLFCIPLISMWLNPTPSFIFLFIIHVTDLKIPMILYQVVLHSYNLLFYANIQHVGRYLLKWFVPKFVFKNFLSFGEGNVDSSLRNNTLLPLFHNKIL